MTFKLYVLSGKDMGRTMTFPTGVVLIGRGEGVEMQLSEGGVSRKHAQLTPHSSGSVQLEDLGSTSGTFLDNERVQRCLISDGTVFRVSTVEIRLRIELEEGKSNSDTGHSGASGRDPGVAKDLDRGGLAELGVEDSESELELEGEWDDSVAPTPSEAPSTGDSNLNTGSAPTSERDKFASGGKAPLRKTPSKQGKATSEGRMPRTSGAQKTSSGGRILQYSYHDATGAGEFAQRPSWQKTAWMVFAVALLGGLAYGAFQLTQGVRSVRTKVPLETGNGEPGADSASDATGESTGQ